MTNEPQPLRERAKANPLAQQFTARSLLLFVFPTVLMMLFSGIYTVVDTVFISRFVHTNALSALNIVTPLISLVVGVATMMATGGSAIVARKMGSGRVGDAQKDFTLIALACLLLGGIISALGLLYIDQAIYALGASELLFPYAKDYLSIWLLFVPANMLQVLFASLFVTAGKPGLGMAAAIAAGLFNMLFDYILLVPFGLGIRGAALATGLAYLIPTVTGALFFGGNKKGALRFAAPHFRLRVLGKSCLNGASEMLGQLSMAITTFFFNAAMMELLGENGVAAITIMIYFQFLLATLSIGFSMGVAPLISYNYGSQNDRQLKRIMRLCLSFISVVSLVAFAATMLGGPFLAGIFSPRGTPVYEIARRGFLIFPIGFLFCGFNIFSSALFTALSNGKASAAISLLRTLVFLLPGILFLPKLLHSDGIWSAVPFAETLTFVVALLLVRKYKHRYRYL